tara:strand:+ start:171 stop:1013 length:843 start_codon:yes stop_codon:yes gene_type:complete
VTTFSFEYFPAKTDKGNLRLLDTARTLAKKKPSFMTVTYGAGGSTKDGTLDTVTCLQRETGVPMAAHVTFINTEIPQLKKFADELWDKGIKRLVALRGDLPDDLSWPLDLEGNYFQYTSEFVAALKSWHNFDISVGAYPEKHPDAPSLAADVRALRLKCVAGADRAITQFFFDNSIYYKFLEECEKAHIKTPVVPGLLPIHDFQSMLSFAEKCRATVPDDIRKKFEALKHNPEGAKDLAQDLLCAQVEDLASQGCPHVHFYTLNKSDLVDMACQSINAAV